MTYCALPLTGASLAVPGPALGPAPGLPSATDRLDRARARLATRLVAAAGPDGLLRAPCDSRILESALALRLLTVTGVDPDAQERLMRRLKTALDEGAPDPVQEAAARAALGEYVDGPAALTRLLGGFDHFTAGRKRLMFQTVLAELGAHTFPELPSPESVFEARGQQRWLVTEMAALKVLHSFGTGSPRLVTEDDWRTLAPCALPGPPPYGNHLARILALLALRHRARYAAAVDARARELRGQLRADGGLPFITGMDVFATATGGLALAGAGAPTHTLRALATALTERQNPDGGWGFDRAVAQSDVDDTSYCMEFLRATAPERFGAEVAAGERYLLARRGEDGGFPTFEPGTASEVAITAAAVNALAPSPAHRPVVEAAVRFMAARQETAGPFERSWSLNESNALFRTVLAYDSFHAVAPGRPEESGRAAAIEVARARARAVARLVDTQNPDGGWGHVPSDPSDPISTAYALIAVARTPAVPSAVGATERAVRHLLERQRPDGGFVSRPDQAGPRPLAYHVPLLTDVCVLLGLNHARAAAARDPRLTPTPTPPTAPTGKEAV
ncbi:prenyltransferase/squalene oxidase repeat-containing protein [Streptomyces sp. NBC_00572]|uniref:prenyltransferase/squalene oxidase repeat-containing protein n=1 Tax=Streptomyces sp. NBC_00572 TaxID=2903664 RepID=UPI00224D30E2|nr:prenyltransferase/squalene oxidase repeat-containing protein [Streptomyces sp. NBC_00572]MCX4980729.1 terpene cyclase/mutase family protein [Streptomyces sp. NBC_00572]